MTKAEFLHLNASTQRWVLLRCLSFALSSLLNIVAGPEHARTARRQLFELCDTAAQEEVTLD